MSREDLIRKMNELTEDPVHPLQSVSVGIIREGEIVFADTAGICRIDPDTRRETAATPNTKFRMASISKLLTATAVWQQIEAGVLDAETDAGEVLGFRMRNPNAPDVPITIGMLLSHTSSIREGSDEMTVPYNIPYPHTVREFFDEQSPCYCPQCWAGTGEKPGQFYSYCNFNYGLLGTILERVSGERFDQYMIHHLFQPLGLDCGFYVPSMTDPARETVGTLYRKLDKHGRYEPVHGQWVSQCDDFSQGYPEEVQGYQIGTNATVFSPQGGLRASVLDMMVLMQAWMGSAASRILSPETMQKMTRPVWTFDPVSRNGDSEMDQCYARGPQVFLNRPGLDCLVKDEPLPFIGHTAGAYGLKGTLGMDLNRKNGLLVVVTGTGGSYPGVYSCNNRWEEELLTAAARYAHFGYGTTDEQHHG